MYFMDQYILVPGLINFIDNSIPERIYECVAGAVVSTSKDRPRIFVVVLEYKNSR